MKTYFGPARSVTSWGRVERPQHEVGRPMFRDEISPTLAARGDGSVLSVGLGRSYGDSVLNGGGRLVDMTGLDRIISLDLERGILRAEAGLSLGDLTAVTVPYGWFTATTPGTRFVTLGGAIANDIHGKNHHSAGSFGNSVLRICLVRSDSGEIEIAPDTHPDLFAATVGGLGLTGIMSWVEIQLVRIPSAYVDVERIAFGSVPDFFRIASESDSFEHTVAWIDCAIEGKKLGRGIFQRANWALQGGLEPHSDQAKLRFPAEAPSMALNRYSVRAFNAAYYRAQAWGAATQRLHYAPFFYPLDAILRWNRMYGRHGLYQYQCVIPPEAAEAAVIELVHRVARAGAASFLAVLKTLGPIAPVGMLSFPCEGATLALDFPNRGAATMKLFAELDAIVADAGGRLYPAKDGRMPAAVFQAGYPQIHEFRQFVDPGINSNFWQRVSQ